MQRITKAVKQLAPHDAAGSLTLAINMPWDVEEGSDQDGSNSGISYSTDKTVFNNEYVGKEVGEGERP